MAARLDRCRVLEVQELRKSEGGKMKIEDIEKVRTLAPKNSPIGLWIAEACDEVERLQAFVERVADYCNDPHLVKLAHDHKKRMGMTL